MPDRNWDAELAKIDKQLASVSDEQLRAARTPATGNAAKGGSPRADVSMVAPAPTISRGRSWTAWLKVVIAVVAVLTVVLWPWPARCGVPLIVYTAATGGVVLLGVWSATGTWRHRLGLAHVTSLLVIALAVVLAAREVLPRAGYAIPTELRGQTWICETVPQSVPSSGSQPATPL